MAKDDATRTRSFGRRAFLKGTAATAGFAALAAVGCSSDKPEEPAPADDGAADVKADAEPKPAKAPVQAPPEEIYQGVCRGNCFGGCSLDVKVRDGKVVATTATKLPDPAYSRICQRGHSHLQRIYDPDRLKAPIRRVGERGAGEWEQITWDEAIDEITTKWKQYQSESGPESIAFMAGSGNFGVSATNYAGRLRDAMGGTLVQFCYDNCYFHAGLHAEGVGECFLGNEIADIVNAKYVFLWGTNPSVAQPQNWHFIMDAKEAGAKVVVIDPNFTLSAARADVFVPIRPGTDNALLMAMINEIVDNGWIDADYIKASTVGPYLVKASDGKFLRGSDIGIEPTTTTNAAGKEVTVDPIMVRDADGNVGTVEEIANPVIEGSFEIEGNEVTCAYTMLVESCKPWTVARAAELCDIPESTIKDLAKMYAEGPSTIYQGFGPDHYVNGERVYFTQYAMAAITHNVGRPGASCGYDWTYAGLMKYVKPALLTPQGAAASLTTVSPAMLEQVKAKEVEGKPFDLRSLYIWVSNPLGNQTDRNSWIELFNMLDLVVVVDMRLGDTANYADIVLPCVHWFESTEIMPQTSPYLVLQEKAIDPLYESKTDVEIVNLLARGMGIENFEMTIEDYLAGTLNNDLAKADNITWDRLKKEKVIKILSGEPHYIHGESGVFRTASTRLNLYYESPTPYIVYGQSFDVEKNRLPYWEPPCEAWPETVAEFEANPLAERFPLIFTTERNKMKCHTQWGHSPWLLELYNEPVIRIHPTDADARGIKEGDYVRAFNDRGEAVFRANIHPGARPGVVIAPKGWEEDQFKKGHYSNLTSRAFNPFTPNNCFFDALIEIEKA